VELSGGGLRHDGRGRRLAQDAIDRVRRRVQQDTHGNRGHNGDPLYGIRRILLRGAENLTAKSYARLSAGLDVGDPNREVTAAYIACQELRHLYSAPDLDRARRRLHTFYEACASPGVPELEQLGRTISAWEQQLLAYFTTGGVSNGPTEAVNLLVKRIKRVSDSATSTTTGSTSSCTAASPGTLTKRVESTDVVYDDLLDERVVRT
jgi:transposase